MPAVSFFLPVAAAEAAAAAATAWSVGGARQALCSTLCLTPPPTFFLSGAFSLLTSSKAPTAERTPDQETGRDMQQPDDTSRPRHIHCVLFRSYVFVRFFSSS